MKNFLTLFAALAFTTGVVSAQLQPIELDIEPMELKDVEFQGQLKMGGALSFDWHGPITPYSHDIDVNFTQGGTLLVEVNFQPAEFIPFGLSTPVQAWPLTGSGQIRIKVVNLLATGVQQRIEGYLIDANFQEVGYFQIQDCPVGCDQVDVFEAPDLYFTSDPVDPNDLQVDKPVFATGYGLSQITNRENRVRYWMIDPLGNQVNFPYQVPNPGFTSYDEMNFPFWAFIPGNYTVCASYNHADIGLPAHFGETVIIPSTCLTFPHNGLSTSLGEQHFEELAAKGLFAWPSPVGVEPFTLTSVAAGNLRVVNAMGAVVSLERIQQGDNRLDPSGWGASGVYILALEGEDGQGFSTTVVKL